ncbi:chitin deacetylase [Linnemannia zychae]|nr:chitin deacetylase [Linnemannia zychae]
MPLKIKRSSNGSRQGHSPILVYTTIICFLASIFTSVAAAINKADYPPSSAVPSVDHPQVKQWLSEIDLKGAPKIPLNVGEPPDCPDKVDDGVCYWTCDDCASDDVVQCPERNVWGLTFDDGPTSATPDLLAYLDQQNVKATFFLIGANVIQYPDIVVKEAAAGHHLASHTWSHHALTTLTNEQIVAEIKWTEKAILEAAGLRVRYMRPPYGDIDNRVRFVLKKLGYAIVDWGGDTFDSNDWKTPEVSKSSVVSHLEKSIATYAHSPNNTSGFISLEHDLTDETVAVAKSLIAYGKQHNLQIMSVAECLHDASPYGVANNIAVVVPPINISSPSIPATAPTGPATTVGGLDLNDGHHNSAKKKMLSMWLLGSTLGSVLFIVGLILP